MIPARSLLGQALVWLALFALVVPPLAMAAAVVLKICGVV